MRELPRYRLRTEEEKLQRQKTQAQVAVDLENEGILSIPTVRKIDDCMRANILAMVATFSEASSFPKMVAHKFIQLLDIDERQLALAIMKRDTSDPRAAHYLEWAEQNNNWKTRSAIRANHRMHGLR